MDKKDHNFMIPESELRHKASKEGITDFAVGIVVVRERKVLVVRRVQHDFLGGYYELPGGGVDAEESFEDAVLRELAEETCLRVIAIHDMMAGFDYCMGKRTVRQINFVVETHCDDLKLNPEEHDNAFWIAEKDIERLKISNEMKQSIERIFASMKKI